MSSPKNKAVHGYKPSPIEGKPIKPKFFANEINTSGIKNIKLKG
jgi:hypothetical protein